MFQSRLRPFWLDARVVEVGGLSADKCRAVTKMGFPIWPTGPPGARPAVPCAVHPKAWQEKQQTSPCTALAVPHFPPTFYANGNGSGVNMMAAPPFVTASRVRPLRPEGTLPRW